MTDSTTTPAPRAPSARSTTYAVAALLAIVLSLVACQRCSSPANAPGPDDELAQLKATLTGAKFLILTGRIACNFAPDPDECGRIADALDDAATIAQALVESGEACRAAGDQECVTAAISKARTVLPNLRRLLSRYEDATAPLPSGSWPTIDSAAAAPVAPAGSAR